MSRIFLERPNGSLEEYKPTGEIIRPPVQHSPYVPIGYSLKFEEDFSNFKVHDKDTVEFETRWIDSFKAWNVRHLKGNDNQGLFVIDKDTHLVENGNLVLRTQNRPQIGISGGRKTTLPYTAPMISTELGFSYLYGYSEFRLRARLSQGFHFSAWHLAADGSYNEKTEIAEMDNLELINSEPWGSFHQRGFGAGSPNYPTIHPTEWHTYGMMWRESEVAWFVDGVEVNRQFASMPRPAYFLMTIEIGGGNSWPGWPSDTTQWPGEVEVDYIRIYQQA